MTASLVGSAGAVAGGATAATAPLPQATTAGNLLVAWVVTSSLVTATTGPSGWVSAKKVSAAARADAEIWYKPNCAASEADPVFSNTSATKLWAFACEFSGAVTSSPVDQTGSANGTSSPVSVSCSANDTTAADLVIVCTGTGSSVSSTGTFSHSAGWTDLANNGGTANTLHIDGAYRVNTTGGAAADTDTVGFTGSSVDVAAVVVSFLPVLSAATTRPIVVPSSAVQRAASW